VVFLAAAGLTETVKFYLTTSPSVDSNYLSLAS